MARPVRFTQEEARSAIAESKSFSEALRRLGLRPAGGNHQTLKKYASKWGISTAHFDPNWATRANNQRVRKPLDEILVSNSTYSRGHLKDRLYDEGVKDRECELCGQSEEWRGQRMALILDHINGVGNDNRIENLRIVCPNCAATFDTHCGRQNRRGPSERSCERCGRRFFAKYRTHRYCSQRCGTRAPRSNRGVPQLRCRKASRPPLDVLRSYIDQHGYVGAGRKYGVSDNAVRKWLVWYERQQEREQAAA
jgi:hypothetical protein